MEPDSAGGQTGGQARRWPPDVATLLGRVRAARRRWYLALGLSAALGLVVGLPLAGIEALINNVGVGPLRRAPLAAQLVVPPVGLAVVWLVLRVGAGGASPFFSDEYIAAYHDPRHPVDLRQVPARLVAGAVTLATGAAMGLEALGIYLGAAAATAFSRRFRDVLSGENARVFLVAGAAAGVSAVFKAPATGAVFALEVPFQQDTAPGAVLPALVASAVAYLAVALTTGTTPILAVGANPSFGAAELLGALVVGVACGVGARLFARLMAEAKRFALGHAPAVRIGVASIAVGGAVLVTRAAYSGPLTLGAGYDVISWATDPRHSLGLVAGLFALRLVATGATQAGGGSGGMFVPLVVQGALLGRLVQDGMQGLGVISGDRAGALFVLVGMAAFLGAGYRVPLAAVMFVAETTGKPGFIVPALLACAAAQLVMGRRSVSAYQREMRVGHVESRFELPVARVMRTDVRTVGPEVTLDDLLHVHLPAAQARAAPVVDGRGRYLGMVRLRDVEQVERAERAHRTVGEVLTVPPGAEPTWVLRQALEAMQDAGVEQLAVVTDDRRFLGIVTLPAIYGFERPGGSTTPPPPPVR